MQKIGILFLIVGIAMFLVFWGAGFVQFLFSPQVPVIFKVAFFCVAAGSVLVIAGALKERLSKKDKYEEVQQ